MESTITIDQTGDIKFLWDDNLADLLELGKPEVLRASYVEPTPDGQWTADLSPIGGPTLGPYKLRSEALAAETAWIKAYHL